MSSDQPQPIGPESGRPPVALTVATVVALSQVLAFYLAIRLAASFRIPFRRGIFFLGVLLAAGAIASAAVRAVTHHHGSGYAIPLFASGGFVAAFAVTIAAGMRLVGPVVLVPGGIGSFLGTYIVIEWWSRTPPKTAPPDATGYDA